LGIAPVVIVAILVVAVVVAGVGAYVFILTPPGASGTHTSGVTTGTGSRPTTTASSRTSSSGGQVLRTYSGTFSYSIPVGPSGVRVDNDSKIETYGSVQVASGTFSFFINPANYSGVGAGQGTMTVTTSGFCSGATSFPYSFKVTNANDLLNGNITVAFGVPTPATFNVPLSCTGSLAGVDTSTNDPAPFLSVYPNLVSVHSVPVTVTQHLTGNITYQFMISPTD
jgi:hypothetical protein